MTRTLGTAARAAASLLPQKPTDQHDDLRTDVQNEEPEKQFIGKLIVAIDMGTTQCAVATAEVLYPPHKRANQIPQVILYEGWNGAYQDGGQKRAYPSTSVYYQDNGTAITGHDVEVLEKLCDPSIFKPANHIRLWKLMFHEHLDDLQTETIQARIQAQLDKLGKTPTDLLRDWARCLLKNDLGITADGDQGSQLRSQYENFDRLEIEVVIAVPPGRTTIAHAQVTQAFVQAPLTSISVSLESEPAAMFRSWVEDGKDHQDWVVGRRYLVADGGGGTCCFVRFRLDRLNPLGFTQEFASESVICGAETVSDAMESLIAQKLPMNHKHREWEISRMRNDFESFYKHNVGSKVLIDSIAFKISGCLDSFIRIPMTEVEKCFDPCVAKLNEGMQRQINKGNPDEGVDSILLGGGLFQNSYVLEKVRAEFKPLNIRQISKKKGHVAIGCVLSRINGEFFTKSFVTTTKAITTLQAVTPDIRQSKYYPSLHTKPGDFDGQEYFWCAEYLVKKGDQTAAGKGFSTEKSVKDARKRYIDPEEISDDYCDTILTFTHQPESKDRWAACCKDGSWVDERGDRVPHPIHSEKVYWNPYKSKDSNDRKPGVTVADLDSERTKDGERYKVLRYSLDLLVNEVSTSIWVKVFSSKKIKKKTHRNVAFLSEPILREPLFTPQAISQSLADSFELDTGSKKIEPVQSQERSVHKSNQPDPEQTIIVLPAEASMRSRVNTHSTRTTLHKTPMISPTFNNSETAVDILASCWSCALRKVPCEVHEDSCTQCKQYRLACGGAIRPHWWHDQDIRKEQLVLLNDKIHELCSDEARQALAAYGARCSNPAQLATRVPARPPATEGSSSFTPVNRTAMNGMIKTPSTLKGYREPPTTTSYSSIEAFPKRRAPRDSIRASSSFHSPNSTPPSHSSVNAFPERRAPSDFRTASSLYPSPNKTPPFQAIPPKQLSVLSLSLSPPRSHNNASAHPSHSLLPPKSLFSLTASPKPKSNSNPDPDTSDPDSDDIYIGPPPLKRSRPITPGMCIRGRSRRSRRMDTQRRRNPEMKSWDDKDVCIEEESPGFGS
ncbi:hypothetical protein VTL71DRAFT_15081 [Oculimacula yallundae]|uniref:Zn(2)-C6 fungal-type domain-containing protein n=1 Tax=Oculimacula yallundae TaxID=86028 RepID=A0ABR4CFN1_9HELO